MSTTKDSGSGQTAGRSDGSQAESSRLRRRVWSRDVELESRNGYDLTVNRSELPVRDRLSLLDSDVPGEDYEVYDLEEIIEEYGDGTLDPIPESTLQGMGTRTLRKRLANLLRLAHCDENGPYLQAEFARNAKRVIEELLVRAESSVSYAGDESRETGSGKVSSGSIGDFAGGK